MHHMVPPTRPSCGSRLLHNGSQLNTTCIFPDNLSSNEPQTGINVDAKECVRSRRQETIAQAELCALPSFCTFVGANLHVHHLKRPFYFIFRLFNRILVAYTLRNKVTTALQQLLVHANVYADKILSFGLVDACTPDLKDFGNSVSFHCCSGCS